MGVQRVSGRDRMTRWLLFFSLLLSVPADAAGPDDLDFVVASSLPPWMKAAVTRYGEDLAPFVLSAHLNPFYYQGDFDGDGRGDGAILVKERSTGKKGILVLDGASRPPVVLGAGRSVGNGGDDFSWMDAWYVHPRGAVGQGVTEEEPPRLRGDGLMLIKTESASGLVYWTGADYGWYQQGD